MTGRLATMRGFCEWAVQTVGRGILIATGVSIVPEILVLMSDGPAGVAAGESYDVFPGECPWPGLP
jgi:hypothetical protein